MNTKMSIDDHESEKKKRIVNDFDDFLNEEVEELKSMMSCAKLIDKIEQILRFGEEELRIRRNNNEEFRKMIHKAENDFERLKAKTKH